jgi:hypothetical protein
MVRAMFHQRLVNLLTSNLRGPTTPLTLAGARILELFQVGVVQGNVAIAVGTLSYAGQLNIDIVSDADVVPDLGLFAQGLADALAELGIENRRPRGLSPPEAQPGVDLSGQQGRAGRRETCGGRTSGAPAPFPE